MLLLPPQSYLIRSVATAECLETHPKDSPQKRNTAVSTGPHRDLTRLAQTVAGAEGQAPIVQQLRLEHQVAVSRQATVEYVHPFERRVPHSKDAGDHYAQERSAVTGIKTS